MKNSKGFTLVELLVVIAVSSVLLLLLTQIFFSSLKGNNKAQALAIIKQNGASVLDEIDLSVRNADNVVCPFIAPGSVLPVSSNNLVVIKNGVFTRYRFRFKDTTACEARDQDPKDQNLANGQVDKDIIDLSNPSTTLRDLTQQGINNYITNNLCNEQDALLNPIPLTDNTPQGVTVVCGAFTRSRLNGFKDIVTINFQLSPAPEIDKKTFSQVSPVSFKTSVELR